MTKRCRVCGEVKPLDDYYLARGTRDGRRTECKACNLAEKAWRHSLDPQPARDRTARWRDENPERYAANQARTRATGGKKRSDRRSYLKRKYGITVEQYDEMLTAQGGVCFICGREPRDDISLHVDHDHETGAIRKLLCFRCNNALGDLDDDPDLLRAAADYLDAHDPEVRELAGLTRRRLAALLA